MLRCFVLLLLLLIGPVLFGVPAQKPKATVYLFLATDCPIAGRYGPRLRALSETYTRRGVSFIAVFPNERETADRVLSWLKERRLVKLTPSRNAALVKKLGATHTPQAVLTDATGKIRYSGRIDNADDIARVNDPTLALALDAFLAGKKIARARTVPFGCELSTAPAPGKGVPFSTVQPIFEKHCTPCHRVGEVGPMPLDDRKTALGFARKIKEQTQSKRMPPWKADSNGEFYDETKLSAAELAAIARWADNPSPVGGAESVRPAPQQEATWSLGRPDVVYSMPEFETPAEGKDFYRCFVIPAENAEADRWVKGVEFLPGSRAVVHHASVFIDLSGEARRMDEKDPGPGYTNPTPGNGPGFGSALGVLGGWTPGHRPRKLAPGVGVWLPKGADLVLEVHYHLSGKVERDRTRFGVFYATEPMEKRLHLTGVGTQQFSIPPGAKRHLVEARETIFADITLRSITPHMHERGVRMVATAELPGGEFKKLIDVPRWDFAWQPSYRFKEPLKLPRGTVVTVKGYFDNPTDKEIRWGESTDDEMCVTFFAYTRDDENLLEDPVIIR